MSQSFPENLQHVYLESPKSLDVKVECELQPNSGDEEINLVCMPPPSPSSNNGPIELEITDISALTEENVEWINANGKRVKDIPGRKRFLSKWLELPEFQGWLEETKDSAHARCKWCQKELQAGKSDLLKHAATAKHKKKLEYLMTVIKEPLDQKVIDLRAQAGNASSSMLANIAETFAENRDADALDNQFKKLEVDVANALGKEEGMYVYSSYVANKLAVAVHCPVKYSTVIVGKNSCMRRILRSSTFVELLEDMPNGIFDKYQLRLMVEKADKPCLVCIENCHLAAGGYPLDTEWVSDVLAICNENNAFVHLDGTRLINAAVADQATLSSLCEGCATVTFGLDESISGPAGCVLAGPSSFIERARMRAKLHYPIPRSFGIMAAGCVYSLTKTVHVVLKEQEEAKAIAKAVQELNSHCITADINRTKTSIVQMICDGVTADDFIARLKETNHDEIVALGEPIAMRATKQSTSKNSEIVALDTHTDLSENTVDKTIRKLTYVIKQMTEQALDYLINGHDASSDNLD